MNGVSAARAMQSRLQKPSSRDKSLEPSILPQLHDPPKSHTRKIKQPTMTRKETYLDLYISRKMLSYRMVKLPLAFHVIVEEQ
jgi:hypothetical protein